VPLRPAYDNEAMRHRIVAFLTVCTLAIALACTNTPDDVAPKNVETTQSPEPVGTPITSPLNLGEPLTGVTGMGDRSALSPKYGDVLVLANRGDPPSGFDTMRTSSIALHHVAGALFGPGNLVMRCRENLYLACPYLATSWVANPGFTEWTFTLRNDVLWHDGTPFTPEDVVFWFDLAVNGYQVGDKVRAPAYFKGDLGDIQSVEALPANRVKITLGGRNKFFLDVLANPRIKFAHPKHLMEPRLLAGDMSVSPLDIGLVGLGPFKFKDYQRGTQVQVRRFNDYFEVDSVGNPLPYLDGINYIIMKEPAAMDAAFRSGRLDGGARGSRHYLTAERKQGYVNDLGDDVYYAEIEGGMFRLAFNMFKDGPWQDPRVRRAISLWLDRDASIPVVLGGFGWTTPSLGPPNPFKDKAFVVWPTFDTEPLAERRVEAKRLMVEAGYAGGFSMGHLCRAAQTPGCELLQAQLKGLGVDLGIQIIDEGEWNRARVSLDFDSQQGRLSVLPIPEGTEGVYGVYSQSPDSYAKHEDPRVSELYRLLREATLPERRLGIWRQLQEYIFVEQTYIVAISEAIYVAPYRSYVKGLVIPPEDGHSNTDFATVWIDQSKK
jgi:peptide/nickel transport system substrate-binding protein